MIQVDEIQVIVKKYKGLLKDIDTLIKESGYRPSYFAEKLNLSRSAFYAKRKNGAFTVSEMDQIVEMLFISNEVEKRTRRTPVREKKHSSETEEDIRIMEEIELTDTLISQDEFNKIIGLYAD